MRRTYPLAVLAVVLAGMIGWALLFTVLYGWVSLACTPPLSAGALSAFRIGAVVVSVLLLAALGGVAFLHWRRSRFASPSRAGLRTFLTASTVALAAAGFVASAWLTLPVMMFSDCRG
jgi:hypothetical protein